MSNTQSWLHKTEDMVEPYIEQNQPIPWAEILAYTLPDLESAFSFATEGEWIQNLASSIQLLNAINTQLSNTNTPLRLKVLTPAGTVMSSGAMLENLQHPTPSYNKIRFALMDTSQVDIPILSSVHPFHFLPSNTQKTSAIHGVRVVSTPLSIPDWLKQTCGQGSKLLGEGSFGQVWQCGLDKAIKLQTLHPQRPLEKQIQQIQMETSIPTWIDEKCRADGVTDKCDFTRVLDTYILQRIGSSPGTTSSSFVTIMPLITGGDASRFRSIEYIQGPQDPTYMELQENPWSIQTFVTDVAHLATTLAEMHSLGIVHRDIKPENLLYDENTKRLSLSDFGVSCFLKTSPNPEQFRASETNLCKGRLGGTMLYLDPQSLNKWGLNANRQVNTDNQFMDFASDAFALGITLWELLLGQRYFTSADNVPRAELQQGQNSRPSLQLFLMRYADRNAQLLRFGARELKSISDPLLRSQWEYVILAIMLLTHPVIIDLRPTMQEIESALSDPQLPIRLESGDVFDRVNPQTIEMLRSYLLNPSQINPSTLTLLPADYEFSQAASRVPKSSSTPTRTPVRASVRTPIRTSPSPISYRSTSSFSTLPTRPRSRY
ncbi:MAG: PAS domain S-box protein [Sylvanvirus sp.]|uniref:PAS domain S-box protein n=1 Tax=Sylvanvirus sp. TaxID=2487774 RepID=A0A3G5AIZ1_9VIRU|nr:MAG: PAS domain S-box protein [Sylvanvirus sp.]